MTVLASYNLKGGVGKTATAVTLAHLAAGDGLRVLLWDLDPQGAATWTFRVEPRVRGGAKALVRGKRSAGEAIKGTDHENLDLLPADLRYRNLDLLLDAGKRPRDRLRQVLGDEVDAYDLVVLDCPPALSLTSESVFALSDALVVPLIPTTLSVRTLEQLAAFVEDQGLDHLALLPFFTMVDRRRRLHARVMDELPPRFPQVLSARVPAASDVERVSQERRPLHAFAPRSAAARAYGALWAEVRGRVGL